MTHDMVMVGAGNRGYRAYGPFALHHPELVRFVAVADPDVERRERFAAAHGIPPERRFASWEDVAARPGLASTAVNTTMDRLHYRSTVALLEAGYDMLLEKPIATMAWECADLVARARKLGRRLEVCHVMRYAPFFRKLRDLVVSGALGDIVSMDWRENLAYWHYAYAYIRGRWANSDRSAPMILAKCCHDLDQILWILDRAPRRLTSFGALRHFQPSAAPPGVPERCTDGCPIEAECPYFAPRFYLGPNASPTSLDSISLDHSPEAILEALRRGPYGRCVYRSDNNVVENQAVMLEFDDGLVATLTMQGASHVPGRTVRIDGTRATLLASQPDNEITLAEHGADSITVFHPERPRSGHGGGDEGVMAAFVESLERGPGSMDDALATGLQAHLLAFAAEVSRLERRVIDLEAFSRAAVVPPAPADAATQRS